MPRHKKPITRSPNLIYHSNPYNILYQISSQINLSICQSSCHANGTIPQACIIIWCFLIMVERPGVEWTWVRTRVRRFRQTRARESHAPRPPLLCTSHLPGNLTSILQYFQQGREERADVDAECEQSSRVTGKLEVGCGSFIFRCFSQQRNEGCAQCGADAARYTTEGWSTPWYTWYTWATR